MNKRQKKKKEKQRAWDDELMQLYKEWQATKVKPNLNRNGEGYYDPTMGKALANLIRKGY